MKKSILALMCFVVANFALGQEIKDSLVNLNPNKKTQLWNLQIYGGANSELIIVNYNIIQLMLLIMLTQHICALLISSMSY